MLTDKATVKTEAIFPDDRKHRYILKKEINSYYFGQLRNIRISRVFIFYIWQDI
jgi:hypothetical protein